MSGNGLNDSKSHRVDCHFDDSILDLKLCVRTRKCLARLEVRTLDQLVEKSSDDLLVVRNFGVMGLNEIRSKLAERGLHLKNDEERAEANERQKEIFECLFKAWSENEMPLYGGYSYQEVFELMESFGVDTSEAKTKLEEFSRKAKDVAANHLHQSDLPDQ